MSIGIWQIVLILVLVLILFGAGKLPKVMGDMGKGVRNLKAGLKGEDETTASPKLNDPNTVDGEVAKKPAKTSKKS